MERINWKSEYETLEKVAFSLEMECRKESLRKIIDDNDGQPGYKLVSKGKESVA